MWSGRSLAAPSVRWMSIDDRNTRNCVALEFDMIEDLLACFTMGWKTQFSRLFDKKRAKILPHFRSKKSKWSDSYNLYLFYIKAAQPNHFYKENFYKLGWVMMHLWKFLLDGLYSPMLDKVNHMHASIRKNRNRKEQDGKTTNECLFLSLKL